MTILFPSEPYNIKKVDSSFEIEDDICKMLDIKVALFDHDLFIETGKVKHSSITEPCILRGWMLTDDQYTELSKHIDLLVSPKQYINAHHFINIYEEIEEFAIDIFASFDLDEMTDSLIENIQDLTETDLIIKDYVKSDQAGNIFHISKNSAKTNLKKIVLDFVEARKPLFNRGIILKPAVEFNRYTNVTNEWRAFYYKGELISMDLNTPLIYDQVSPPVDFVKHVGQLVKNSIFYTIDFGELSDGTWKIIEAGDGQVSGLPSTYGDDQIIQFYDKLNNIIDNGNKR